MTSHDHVPDGQELRVVEAEIRDFFESEGFAGEASPGELVVQAPMSVLACTTDAIRTKPLREAARKIERFHHQLVLAGQPVGYGWSRWEGDHLAIAELSNDRRRATSIARGVNAMAHLLPLDLVEIPDAQAVALWSQTAARIMLVHAPECPPSACFVLISEDELVKRLRPPAPPGMGLRDCRPGLGGGLRGPYDPIARSLRLAGTHL